MWKKYRLANEYWIKRVQEDCDVELVEGCTVMVKAGEYLCRSSNSSDIVVLDETHVKSDFVEIEKY